MWALETNMARDELQVPQSLCIQAEAIGTSQEDSAKFISTSDQSH